MDSFETKTPPKSSSNSLPPPQDPTEAERLGWVIRARLEEIQAAVDQLQRERTILREQATTLRMGRAPLVVLAELRAAGIDLPAGQM